MDSIFFARYVFSNLQGSFGKNAVYHIFFSWDERNPLMIWFVSQMFVGLATLSASLSRTGCRTFFCKQSTSWVRSVNTKMSGNPFRAPPDAEARICIFGLQTNSVSHGMVHRYTRCLSPGRKASHFVEELSCE
jgi:hypothetical protein